jgi:hypothetical protein
MTHKRLHRVAWLVTSVLLMLATRSYAGDFKPVKVSDGPLLFLEGEYDLRVFDPRQHDAPHRLWAAKIYSPDG